MDVSVRSRASAYASVRMLREALDTVHPEIAISIIMDYAKATLTADQAIDLSNEIGRMAWHKAREGEGK